MKILCIILSVLMLASCAREGFLKDEKPEISPPSSQNSGDGALPSESEIPKVEESQVSESEAEEHGEEIKGPLFSKDDWRLILVNLNNPIPDDFSVDLGKVNGYYVDERIADDLKSMIAGAKEDGVDLLICYGYRTKEQSEQLFQKQIKRQQANGLSYEDAVEEAKKWVAPPGTSEHHTGLALDIVTPSYQVLNHEFENTAAAKWMKENAHEYGFILRYPKNKEEITGITFEPWHYRYVGQEAAAFIYENDLCLEEFLKGENVN